MRKINAAIARVLGTGIASILYVLGGAVALCVRRRRQSDTTTFWLKPPDNALDITSAY